MIPDYDELVSKNYDYLAVGSTARVQTGVVVELTRMKQAVN